MFTDKDLRQFTLLYEQTTGTKLNKQEALVLAEQCLGLVNNIIESQVQKIDQPEMGGNIKKQSI
jgi:hypothetical protein